MFYTGALNYGGKKEVRYWRFKLREKTYMSFSDCSHFFNQDDHICVYPSNPLHSELSEILEYLKEDVTECFVEDEND